jgi:hypothetical protein
MKKMFSLAGWNKDTPAKISLLIKTLTGIPAVAALLLHYPEVATGIAVLGAIIDTFYTPKQ